MWQHAIIYPDINNDWAWAEKRLVGLPAIVRVLLTLHGSGIKKVILPATGHNFRSIIEHWSRRKKLPGLVWKDGYGTGDVPSESPVLCVRGGILFEASLLRWFYKLKERTPECMTCVMDSGKLPVLTGYDAAMENDGMEEEEEGKEISVPSNIFCRRVSQLTPSGNDRGLLEMVGKLDEAVHVRWFRNWTFPAVRLFSNLGVSPNQLTWAGFMIGLAGAFILSLGSYWNQVIGALLLCGSWIFDNMDGTLARLTFSESRKGEKLDSTLGHLTNLAFFAALVWAVYGKESILKAGLVSLFMLGSITLALRICQMERRFRNGTEKNSRFKWLQVFLDQINGRDFTVLVLIFALIDGFKFFLWGSLAGLQIFWMLHLWLLYKHRTGTAINSCR